MMPIFGSWVTVTDDAAGRQMRDQGLVTEVMHEEDETGPAWVRVVFEDTPEGVIIPMEHVTADMKWVPWWEKEAIDQVSELLRQRYGSQRQKRDRVAREVYDVMHEIFGEPPRPMDPA